MPETIETPQEARSILRSTSYQTNDGHLLMTEKYSGRGPSEIKMYLSTDRYQQPYTKEPSNAPWHYHAWIVSDQNCATRLQV